MEPDFSGYATKAGLRCSDGRTIMPEAFKDQDKMTVPLVWQHGHGDSKNVLGHAVLENRADGVYAYGFFNQTDNGQNAKVLVEHKDITSLSIYANGLVEKSKQIFHGVIREVSLVLSGANPGAKIDNVRIAHSADDIETLDDEAIIWGGAEIDLSHSDSEDDSEDDETDDQTEDDSDGQNGSDVEHADSDPTVQDIYDSFTTDQKNVVHYMIGAALEAAEANPAAAHSADDETAKHSDQEGSEDMGNRRNVFENNSNDNDASSQALTHDDIRGIVATAARNGSLKHAVEEFAIAHGIDNLDVLFPDAQDPSNTPEWNSRRTEWVAGVLNGTRHSPFSRIKSRSADITLDEARAKGYVTSALKKEEFFSITKRTTAPTTIYKKQKLDRDDVIDISDFDVVAWMKAEMRLMLEEEIARAILIGDGRAVDDEDKIKDPVGSVDGVGIRSILHDHEMYVTSVRANVDDANSNYTEVIEAVARSRKYYKGTGVPTFYTTATVHTEMLLVKDTLGRRIYNNDMELAAALRVDSIVDVEVMEDELTVVGIIVNLADYSVGTDKGGEVSLFDDFDIDYNQLKYLIETRMSGALTKLKSAMVVYKTAAGDVLLPSAAKPTFVEDTGVVTIVATTHVVYKDGAGNTLSTGAQTALDPGESIEVIATPASGYYFANSGDFEWTFARPHSA